MEAHTRGRRVLHSRFDWAQHCDDPEKNFTATKICCWTRCQATTDNYRLRTVQSRQRKETYRKIHPSRAQLGCQTLISLPPSVCAVCLHWLFVFNVWIFYPQTMTFEAWIKAWARAGSSLVSVHTSGLNWTWSRPPPGLIWLMSVFVFGFFFIIPAFQAPRANFFPHSAFLVWINTDLELRRKIKECDPTAVTAPAAEVPFTTARWMRGHFWVLRALTRLLMKTEKTVSWQNDTTALWKCVRKPACRWACQLF